MPTKTAIVPRDEVEQLLIVTEQLVDIVENNVMKRIPKRLSIATVKRAHDACDALKISLFCDNKES